MEESSVHLLKSHCCTCLSKDRKLKQLCRVVGGLNNLYSLLSYDSEAYREGFYMESGLLSVCWECRALLRRFCQFRRQACLAQQLLADIVERRHTEAPGTLSRLAAHSLPALRLPRADGGLVTSPAAADDYRGAADNADHFVDCGSVDVKSEPEDVDDMPLSLLKGTPNGACKDDYVLAINVADTTDSINADFTTECIGTLKKTRKLTKKKSNPKNGLNTGKLQKEAVKKTSPMLNKNKVYFSSIELNEEEFLESREQRKLTISYVNATYKCETCIEGFKHKTDFDSHYLALHTAKSRHTPCSICGCYVKNGALREHVRGHYFKHLCTFCDYVSYSSCEIVKHLRSGHAMHKLIDAASRKRGQHRAPSTSRPGAAPRGSRALTDQRTPFGYLCTECNKYFDNKNQRWKHIQRQHREGHACGACGKRFAFRSTRARHEAMHAAPPPREQCPVCDKMVRVDLSRAHARTHEHRQARSCALCDKTFVSLASYEHHLKYTRAHTTQDILKHKCSQCDKGYRSRAELRDHVNFQHLARTLHQCPICSKALATRRCITRHVRRAHQGLKESPRDKICQQCGKAFRDKKGLHEHELIHTGERPLSCGLCGASFRQSASLYTHRRRVHKVAPRSVTVQHCTGVAPPPAPQPPPVPPPTAPQPPATDQPT